jgi:thiazole synthase
MMSQIISLHGTYEASQGEDMLRIAGMKFRSRLLVGTGKYRSTDMAQQSIQASGAQIITVALRRLDVSRPYTDSIIRTLPPKTYTYLPNTAGCYTAADAIRTLKLAREIEDFSLVKLEVIGDKTFLYPDVIETINAAEKLVDEGFQVMAYTNDDPLIATRLEEAGCVAIMPLGAPIGSGLGIQNPRNIRAIVEQSSVPIILDAGIGTASDAAIAMELGCDGVLLNTAIAEANNPIMMAHAMKCAVEAGRCAYRAGRMQRRGSASPSSPTTHMLS